MTRFIKIGYSSRKNAYRRILFFPKLNLTGKWFREVGFEIGDSVEVQCSNGCITIKRLENGQDS
ncbi:MAG: hypothetical protein CL843_09180 [Crocinitomicaceae bacterium]|nr:hypothetical protein [Crocinitomicaceae bacterium]